MMPRGTGVTFCVGGDTKGMANQSAPPLSFETKHAMMRRTMEISRTLRTLPKPGGAAIEDAAAGVGLSLALACDFRVVGESAEITTAFAKVAVSGDYRGIFYLTQMVGSAKARELYMLSPVLSGREAHDLGLMSCVVPDAEVGAAALDLARSLANGPTISLGYMKANINNAEVLPLEAYVDAEALHQCRCLRVEDYREAVSAFVHNRLPEFQGR
jgi:2-(1,2-epoxy-1,2-dihydrophenyl)acetyl-CoA isomerase